MTLYEKWQQLAVCSRRRKLSWPIARSILPQKRKITRRSLQSRRRIFSGKLAELAEQFDMTPEVFTGFMDGINDSLVCGYEMDKLAEDTDIELKVDFEKLFYNMLDAKAKWLYTLPEWEKILSEEKRKELTRAWRKSGQIVKENKIGRNDPCHVGAARNIKSAAEKIYKRGKPA